jgi:AcrR family transcriptional regulator
MTLSPPDDPSAVGLRERKKARTRAAIQRAALRLFRERGYQETTVEQIAAAADISPSTFFRYFPTKEAVVLQDEFDPMIIEAFKAVPPDVRPITALRRAFGEVFSQLPDEALERTRDRTELVKTVPELRAAMMEEFARNVQMLAELVAERAGRRPDDLAVRTLAGALVGAVMAAMLSWVEGSGRDFQELLDSAVAQLEAGLPL